MLENERAHLCSKYTMAPSFPGIVHLVPCDGANVLVINGVVICSLYRKDQKKDSASAPASSNTNANSSQASGEETAEKSRDANAAPSNDALEAPERQEPGKKAASIAACADDTSNAESCERLQPAQAGEGIFVATFVYSIALLSVFLDPNRCENQTGRMSSGIRPFNERFPVVPCMKVCTRCEAIFVQSLKYVRLAIESVSVEKSIG